MLILTTDNVPGKNIEALSLVTGACIMSKHIGKDIGAGLRNLVGGEMKAYVEMLNQAKDEALERLKEAADAIGADAVVGIRYGSSAIVQGAAEIMVYGTAVKIVG